MIRGIRPIPIITPIIVRPIGTRVERPLLIASVTGLTRSAVIAKDVASIFYVPPFYKNVFKALYKSKHTKIAIAQDKVNRCIVLLNCSCSSSWSIVDM